MKQQLLALGIGAMIFLVSSGCEQQADSLPDVCPDCTNIHPTPPLPEPPPEPVPPEPLDAWEVWFAEHEKTCPQCGGDDSNGPPPLCREAFRKLQRYLRTGEI